MSGSAICVWNAEMPTNWTVLYERQDSMTYTRLCMTLNQGISQSE